MPACYLLTGLFGGSLAAGWSVWAGHPVIVAILAASLCGSFCLLAQAVVVARNRSDEQLD